MARQLFRQASSKSASQPVKKSPAISIKDVEEPETRKNCKFLKPIMASKAEQPHPFINPSVIIMIASHITPRKSAFLKHPRF
jgi:hypothetical protein